VTLPRLLVLMGSGETSPTMVKTHREVMSRLGPPPVPAVLLDTPFGFQANADELAAKAQHYFHESVGADLGVASYRSARSVGSVAYESALTALREARFVFAGPGSPTYALTEWRQSRVPEILRDKLEHGGCVTFASAAALTLGVVTVPVYEIYKVGATPEWAEGLDLLAIAGLNAAVIPHYNNAEGGTHDTRFCYLGEHRLALLEASLPEGAFVLGVDEHTGLVLDLDAGNARVVGLGVVTVRANGHSSTLAAGTEASIASIADLAHSLRARGEHSEAERPTGGQSRSADDKDRPPADTAASPGASPLLATVAEREAAFLQALEARDVDAAVQAVLDLEADLQAWSNETFQSDEFDRARATLRSMVVRLGAVAVGGARDPRELVGPFVDALLAVRSGARQDKRFADADAVRDRLVALGVEVRDSPEGTDWDVAK
jgi:hypothetical protein